MTPAFFFYPSIRNQIRNMQTPEERSLIRKAYRKANKDKIREYNKSYNEANRDAVNRQCAEYRKNNRDKIRSYLLANSDKIKQKRAEYQENNRSREAERANKYRALKRGQSLNLSKPDRQMISEIYRQMTRLNSIFGSVVFNVDHTIPISRGGFHHPNNLQLVPAKWNRSKGNTSTQRWETPFNNNA